MGWTAALAGASVIPTPSPPTIIPGIRWVQPDCALSPRISSRPTPTRISPGPMSSRIGTFDVSRPATVALTRMAPDRNMTRTPVPSGEYPRMSCRYSTRYSSMAKIEALRPNAATLPPVNVGSRNRLRSNIGCAMRRSTKMKATSSTAEATRQPSTRPSVNDR